MNSLQVRGVIHNGQVEVKEPIGFPDGSEVVVQMANGTPSDADAEEGWDTSPEGIATWLRWYDTLEPLKTTATEDAEAEV